MKKTENVSNIVTAADREAAKNIQYPCTDEEYCKGCPHHDPGLELECEHRGDTSACNRQNRKHTERIAADIAEVMHPRRERAARIEKALRRVLRAFGGFTEHQTKTMRNALAEARAALGEGDHEN